MKSFHISTIGIKIEAFVKISVTNFPNISRKIALERQDTTQLPFFNLLPCNLQPSELCLESWEVSGICFYKAKLVLILTFTTGIKVYQVKTYIKITCLWASAIATFLCGLRSSFPKPGTHIFQ